MDDYRAAGVIVLRQIFREQKPDDEANFIASLTAEEMSVYVATLSTTWISCRTAGSIITKAMRVLYPDNLEEGYRQLGRAQARQNLTGIFRSLLKMTTVTFIVNQIDKLWGNFFQRGKITLESNSGEKKGIMIVRDFADLPECILIGIKGFIEGTLELVGAKTVRIDLCMDDPQAWQWTICWE